MNCLSGYQLLKTIVEDFGTLSPMFLEKFSTNDLIKIWHINQSVDYNLPPNEWSELQIKFALDNVIPTWKMFQVNNDDVLFPTFPANLLTKFAFDELLNKFLTNPTKLEEFVNFLLIKTGCHKSEIDSVLQSKFFFTFRNRWYTIHSCNKNMQ